MPELPTWGWALVSIGVVMAAYAIAEMRWAGDPDNMGELFERDWHGEADETA